MVRIAVFGAGAIGCWVGGRLAAGGADVTLIGRARVLHEISEAGAVRVSDLDGGDARAHVTCAIDDPEAARGADVVLVAVKSAATAEAGRALAGIAAGPVVSLQNGVRNAGELRAAMPGARVVAGVVPWNVTRRGPAHYHRASEGTLAIERGAPALIAAARRADLAIAEHATLAPIQWAKLLMNLNNAINALSDLPLRDELSRRDFRRCLAACQREALGLLRAARQPIARLTAIPPRWMPRVLELPDAVFARLARRVLAIDPHARSSMWDDFVAGRPTEIDYIQGEVVALAARLGTAAPINAAVVALVHAVERGAPRVWDGAALWRALVAAR